MLVLITGASRGIGLEMVRKLSKNANVLVIAVSRQTASLQQLVKKNDTHNILPVKADLTKPADLVRISKLVRQLEQKLDVVINNAGTIVKKPFEKINSEELNAVYATNVFAPFLLVQALLPYFNTKKRSHIINIGSMGGFQGSSKFPGLTAYSSSKAALASLTECMAEEFKDRNIAVNCLAIGAVQTEMLSKAFPGYKAPLSAKEMASYICDFALNGHNVFNGKILPVSISTP